jgi:tRNA (Thr-GGU) A37 N-methylase
MGAFNAYEIQQLKSKFQEMSKCHNMLVCVTQQHNVDLRQMKENPKSIMDVIELMEEYNLGIIQLQITEHAYYLKHWNNSKTTKTSHHDPTNQYEPLQIQPLIPLQQQNQALIQY